MHPARPCSSSKPESKPWRALAPAGWTCTRRPPYKRSCELPLPRPLRAAARRAHAALDRARCQVSQTLPAATQRSNPPGPWARPRAARGLRPTTRRAAAHFTRRAVAPRARPSARACPAGDALLPAVAMLRDGERAIPSSLPPLQAPYHLVSQGTKAWRGAWRELGAHQGVRRTAGLAPAVDGERPRMHPPPAHPAATFGSLSCTALDGALEERWPRGERASLYCKVPCV